MRHIIGGGEQNLRGLVRDGLREFKGIPYAAPPVGDLRWTLPRAAKPWKDVLDASKYGSACPQTSRYGLTEASDDENCLTLNIAAPYDGKPARLNPRPEAFRRDFSRTGQYLALDMGRLSAI